MARTLVIGAGMLGSAIAWRLAEAGLPVRMIDAGDGAEQASQGSLCWLNAATCADAEYAAFRIRSLRMWHEIAARHPDCPVQFQGSVVWTDTPSDTDTQIDLMTHLDWPVERLAHADLQALFPGAHHVPDAALLAPREGTAHPGQIVHWVRARAMAAGAQVSGGTVIGLTQAAGRIAGVTLDDGTEIDSEAVIIAAGRNATPLLQGAGLALPQRPGEGLTGWTQPCAAVVGHAVSSDRLDFWQDHMGRVLFTSPAAKTPQNADGMDEQDMLRALAGLCPQLADATVDRSFARTRPLPLDGLPALGHTGPEGLFVACTHSGMTLAPVIADSLAAAVSGTGKSDITARFHIERFQSAETPQGKNGSAAKA